MKFFRSILFLVLVVAQSSASAACISNADDFFELGTSYFSRGQYLLATQQFSTFSLLSCDQAGKDLGRLRWSHSLFELGETAEADLVVRQISSKSSVYPKAEILRAWYLPDLRTSLPAAERARFEAYDRDSIKFEDIKTPWIAGTLSAVVPGLGQAYNGSYQAAAFSFVLNALFFSTTAEFHRKNLDAAALTAGMVFSVVYIGSISSAVQSAKSINQNAYESDRLKLRDSYFPELRP